MRWERADTDEATAQADARQCRASARQIYRNLTSQRLLLPSFVEVRDRKGRLRSIPVTPWRGSASPLWALDDSPWAMDRLMLKQDLYEDCLEAKGYLLVPSDPPS